MEIFWLGCSGRGQDYGFKELPGGSKAWEDNWWGVGVGVCADEVGLLLEGWYGTIATSVTSIKRMKKYIPYSEVEINAAAMAHEQLVDAIFQNLSMDGKFWVESKDILDSLSSSNDRSGNFNIDPSWRHVGAPQEQGESSEEGVWQVGG